MVTTFNGGVSGLIKTLAIEIAPHRVNAVHHATEFLLGNAGVNAHDLAVDGGLLVT